MRLSVQCYTVRDRMAADVWGTLKAIRSFGPRYIQIGDTYGIPVRDFKKGIEDLDLRISGRHVSLDSLENDLEAVLDVDRILENRYIIVPWVGEDRYRDGWGKFAKSIEPLARRITEAGFVFGYHNHAFEFQLQNGRPGLDIFFETANPKWVTAEIDTYWVAYGGANPADYIRKLKGRVPQVHLKDGNLGGEPIYLEAGEGELDWVDILAGCRESEVEFAAIELDTCPRDCLESVRASAEYFQRMGLN